MKRKTLGEGGEEGGRQHRAKSQRTAEEEEAECAIWPGIPWEIKAGMILEVNLRNFMCHEKFTFVPNQRLNFLCGENGSGKSAVLTAIVFALGGTARMASRGSSNKAFIRTNQNSAMVEITLTNVGNNKYRPELYGEKIIINRTVTKSSSSYKLKDSGGRVVVEKKAKEELDRILAHFDIQVDNPITVLNQDTAKTFLAKSDPVMLYQFFHRSTKLHNCEEDYNAAADDKNLSQHLLQEKLGSVAELKKEFRKWEKKLEFFQSLDGKKGNIRVMKQELVWALVRDSEIRMEEIKKEVDKENKKVELAETRIAAIKKQDKAWRDKKKNIEAEIMEIDRNMRPAEEEVKGLKKELAARADKTRQSQRSVTDLNAKLGRAQRDVELLTQEIDKYRSGEYRDYEESHQERLDSIQRLEEEKAAVSAQVATTEKHVEHLAANVEDIGHRLAGERFQIQAERQKAEKARREVEELDRGSRDKLLAFGAWMPRLMAEIAKSTRFGRKPIGPLGAYINIAQGVSEDEAALVENHLKSYLTAFCVDSARDQQTLYDIFTAIKVPSKPVILTSAFQTEKYDIAASRVRSDKFRALIDCVEVEEATVYNHLLDQLKMERILIIPSSEEAQRLLTDPGSVPANLLHALVEGKYQYFPVPAYRSYHMEVRSRGILKASLEDYIRGLRQQVEEKEKLVSGLEKRMSASKQEEAELKRAHAAEQKKLQLLRQKITQKNIQIGNLRNEDAAEQPPDIAALEDDREKLQNEKETIEKQLADAEEAKQRVAVEEQEAKESLDRAQHQLSSMREQAECFNKDLSECEEGIRKSKRDLDHYVAKKAEYAGKAQEKAALLAAKTKERDSEIERAKTWSEERIDTQQNADVLSRSISKMEDSLKQQEETQEPRDTVTSMYQRYNKLLTDANAAISLIQSNITAMDQAIKLRKEGYKFLLRCTCKQVNNNFVSQLDARHFLGTLKFDHTLKTMEIKVDPDKGSTSGAMEMDRSLKSLSGGERSFSLVSLILSLWEVMTPPFRILDEFDVFMDAVNRRVSLNNIINYARKNRQNQFIFLTPLNTSNIDVGEDIKIIKLSKLQSD